MVAIFASRSLSSGVICRGVVVMESKTCPNCVQQGNSEPQPLSAFNLRGGKPRSWCRKCESVVARRSYYKRPEEERRQYRREYEASGQGKAARARVVDARIADGREYLRQRRKLLRSKFALSLQDYESMLEAQDRRCAICRTNDPLSQRGNFYIDHDHTTRQVRGLLCINCNAGLGSFYDNTRLLFTAMTYLNRPMLLIDRSRSYPVRGYVDEALRGNYNITLDSYENLLTRQGGHCAICSREPGTKRLSVDHIEGTKNIRGILCKPCNFALGYFKHNSLLLASAIWYLHKASQLEKAAA